MTQRTRRRFDADLHHRRTAARPGQGETRRSSVLSSTRREREGSSPSPSRRDGTSELGDDISLRSAVAREDPSLRHVFATVDVVPGTDECNRLEERTNTTLQSSRVEWKGKGEGGKVKREPTDGVRL